ncbi:MAG: hypothetical protein AAFX99_28970, partial [Myxococcota bacterium]
MNTTSHPPTPPQPPARQPLGWSLPRGVTLGGLVLLLLLQSAFAFHGLANYWQWGHNGYNSAAYQQAARNTLRSGLLFPAQYVTGPRR